MRIASFDSLFFVLSFSLDAVSAWADVAILCVEMAVRHIWPTASDQNNQKYIAHLDDAWRRRNMFDGRPQRKIRLEAKNHHVFHPLKCHWIYGQCVRWSLWLCCRARLPRKILQMVSCALSTGDLVQYTSMSTKYQFLKWSICGGNQQVKAFIDRVKNSRQSNEFSTKHSLQ